MTNTQSHAKRELEILFATTPDAIIREFETEILALCEKFGKSGQSGGSAPFTAQAISHAIKTLCLQETIAPLTGEDSEWTDVTEMNDGEIMYQNNRNSAVFKDGDGKAYYIDAIIKRNQDGTCWSGSLWKSKEDYLTGNKDLMVGSLGYIKSFPFTPKTFYIDVIEEEVGNHDWEMYLKDTEQLEEVYEYYQRI